MSDRETKLLRSLTENTWRLYAWMGCLIAVLLWGLFAYSTQLRHGLGVTGLRDQISWGLYIIDFIFFIGISIAGTLISAVLRLTHAHWRRPITRMAETITLASLLVSVPLVVVDMGRPDRLLNIFRYARIQSPIVWDFLSVNTYLAACLIYFYLPLIPDLAILAGDARLPSWQQRLYKFLSAGFKGTREQFHELEKGISVMTVIVLPLAISTHTSLAWIFGMTLRPGWNSSIFGPYFVIGAIYSGCASVILLMYFARKVLHLEDYLGIQHFKNLGLLLLTFALLYLYFNVNEYLTIGYKMENTDKLLIQRLFLGDDALLFWGMHILGVIVPALLLITVLAWKRFSGFIIPAVALASALTVVGSWIKRYLIIVPTLSSPFLTATGLPSEWVHYRPSWVEWSITAAASAAFLLIYTILSKLFPTVSLWETREDDVEEQAVARLSAAPAAVQARASMPPAVIVALAGILLSVAVSARADDPAASKNLKPTTLSLQWEALKPAEPAAAPGAAASGPSVFRSIHDFAARVFWNFSPTSNEKSWDIEEEPTEKVRLTATLLDEKGAPVAYQPVGFALKTSFGPLLQFGKMPTDGDGKAKLLLKDRRCGVYPLQAVYGGDQTLRASEADAKVDFGVCPAPGLPSHGVLITPYPTAPIALAFLGFYGTAWSIFVYAFGYQLLWRVRRAGKA